MKRILLTLLALFAFAGASALAQDIRYNFDKQTDFSKFKTYKWVTIEGAKKMDDLRDKQIKEAVDSALSVKGLTKNEENADLFVGYQAGLTSEKEFTSYNSGWGYGPGWGGGWYGGGGGMTTGETSTIYKGVLALDMYNPADKDLIWRGIASKSIDEKASPEKQQKNLQKAVNKLLQKYPPEVKK